MLDVSCAAAKHAPMPINLADFIPAALPQTLDGDEVQLWLFRDETPGETPLRRLLSAYLGKPAEALPIERGLHGKPALAAPTPLHFNLSHSRDLTVIALSACYEPGIDIEFPGRRRPVQALARRYFAAGEAEALAALAPEQAAMAFLALWSCKEAVLKALGRGIAFGLHRLEFALDDDGDPDALLHIAPEAGTPADWQLHRLRLGKAGGTLAWRGASAPVRCFTPGCDAATPRYVMMRA